MVVEKGTKNDSSPRNHHHKSGGESSGLYRPPQVRMQQTQQPHRENPTRVRRPDRAVYVPKARRSIELNGPLPAINPESPPHDVTEAQPANEVSSPPSPPPPQDVKPPKTPTSAKTKRAIDKSFCNVYKPPHARVTNSLPDEVNLPVRNVHLDFSDSPIRTDVTEPFVKVPKQSVPNCESVAPLPLENNIEEDTVNDAACSENDADGAATLAADIEHFDNASVDSTEYVINHINEYNSINNDMIMEPLSEYDDMIDGDKKNWKDERDEDKEHKELIKASEEINRSNRRLIKQSFVSDVLVITGPDEDNKDTSLEQSIENVDIKKDKIKDSPQKSASSFNPEEENWEDLFDENGDWLGADLMEELTMAVGQVTVQKPRRSYENYLSNAPQAFAHVLEVYNFPSEFTNNDLLSVFSDFKDTGFEIKWVDDNHALAVFSSNEIAAQVLAYNHPLVKTRPLHEATLESRTKAKKSAEFLRPYRARPETCTALARRLVSGALGVRLPTHAEERLQEKQKISLAREKKRLAAQNREAAWDGSLTSDV